MINQRLFEHYNIDTTKNLEIPSRCPRPFDTLLIDKKGSCYACECTSWLPQSVGNLQIQTLHEIINRNSMREHLQSSITDGSYRYCNEHQCSYIKSNSVLDWRPKRIEHLRLAIDDSCNLRCPSCRKQLLFLSNSEDPLDKNRVAEYERRKRFADKINVWLETYYYPLQVHIGSDGDPFASHIYRHFMEHTPRRDNIKYSILTNALMFESFHERVPHIINNLQELGVSIDGASKQTYEKLRLGGNWEKINQNLQCISELKQKHNFRFILHFVVQKDNYHEMEDIIQLGKQYNADRVWLNKMEDWNVIENFSDINIFSQEHPLHEDYRQTLQKIKPYLGVEKNPHVEITTLNI
jgi:wyosine [tRNA(Phe)-imidazoG37] synthetase (radical SAM superfamily)